MVSRVNGVIIVYGFVVISEHDAVVLVLAGGVAGIPVLDGCQTREGIACTIIVGDVGLQ
jgi:hypothetical protein